MNRVRGSGRLVVLLALVAASAGFAQVPKAPGLKIGEGRLHPFLELDGRFDSFIGVFTPDGAKASELILHARPGLRFDLQTPSTFINFAGSAEYLWYTGLLYPGSNVLSRFHANVALDTKFNVDGPVEVQLGDNLVRSDRSQTPTASVGVLSLFNNLYLAAPIHPGGRALEITPRVAWSVEFFDPLLPGFLPGCADPSCNPANVSSMNYNNVNFGLNNRWKFLPKTAVVLDANLDWRTYFNAAANVPATLLRVQAGLAGLISPRIAVTLLAGYGGNLAPTVATTVALHTFIATAEVSYTVSEQSRVALGYVRTTSAVPVYGTSINDRGYLRGGVGFLSNRLMLNGQVSADSFIYMLAAARNDVFLSASLMPSFVVASWFDVSASYTFGLRVSSVSGPGSNFNRHEAMLRLAFHY